MVDSVAAASVTRDELAAAVRVDPAHVERWHALGLTVGGPDRFPFVDLERARLIRYAEHRGIDAADVALACQSEDLVTQFLELLANGEPRLGLPIGDAAAAVDLAPDVFQRIWVASGLSDQDDAYDEDITALRWIRTVLAAGLPEDALVQLIRVFADALGRVADAESRLFHYYVHEPLRAAGLEGEALTDATAAVSERLVGLAEPAILYFHRKAFERALRDDFVLHLKEATKPPGPELGEMEVTIMFVDLSGFTPLTESMGDATAARLIERFSDLVRLTARRHQGKIVKQIGDEFMLVFDDPARAIACGIEIGDTIRSEPRFPGVTIGAHHGAVLYREGDYIGTNVNIAARVTALARRHQMLVTEPIANAAHNLAGHELVPIGAHSLKGISEEVELFEVRRTALGVDRAIDPVCHMQLDPEDRVVTLDHDGTDVHFCSTTCADKFIASPERYEPTV
jgi:adenylate cyclase